MNKTASPSLSPSLHHVDGFGQQRADLSLLQIGRVRRSREDVRRLARLKRFEPPRRAQAPLVTRLQTRKRRRVRRGQVVSFRAGEIQKLLRHLRANGVQTEVIGARGAVASKESNRACRESKQAKAPTVTKVTGERLVGAHLQRGAGEVLRRGCAVECVRAVDSHQSRFQ